MNAEETNRLTSNNGNTAAKITVNHNENLKRQEVLKIIENYRTNNQLSADDEYFNPNRIEDYYGFYYVNQIPDKIEASQAKVKLADQKREKKWQKMIDKKYIDKLETKGKLPELFIRRVYKGIPEKFRMKVWPYLLEVSTQKQSNVHVYQTMVNRALDSSSYILQIDLDVNRTFRDTTYFQERYGARQRALFHVLTAYSVYNTEIGYCQGMSDVAGLLLMYMPEEEDAFWALSQLIKGKKYTMHGMFVHDFPKMHSLFRQLERVLTTHLPKIGKHLAQLDLEPSLYAFKWFMQCFLSRVPMSLCLRLWDIYLLEGERVLIAMAYNIFKMHKKKLLKMDYCQISHFFQNELPKDFLYDDDMVITSLKDCMEDLRKSRLDRLPKDTESHSSNVSQSKDKKSMLYSTSPAVNENSNFVSSSSTSKPHHPVTTTQQQQHHDSSIIEVSQSLSSTVLPTEGDTTQHNIKALPPDENLTMPQFYYKSAIPTKEQQLLQSSEVKLKVLPHRQSNSNVIVRSPNTTTKHNNSPKKRNSSASVKQHSTSTRDSPTTAAHSHRNKRISLQEAHIRVVDDNLPHYHYYNNHDVKDLDLQHNPAYRSTSSTPNNNGPTTSHHYYGTRFSLLNNRTSKSVSPPPVSSSSPGTSPINTNGGGQLVSSSRSSSHKSPPISSSPVAFNFGVETSL